MLQILFLDIIMYQVESLICLQIGTKEIQIHLEIFLKGILIHSQVHQMILKTVPLKMLSGQMGIAI